MTGAERAQFAERLRGDEDLRTPIIDAFKRRGMSEMEAQTRYDRAATVSEAMAVPPSQRTDQQNRDVASADADPSFKHDVEAAQAIVAQHPSAASKSALSASFDSAASNSGGSVPPEQPAPIATERSFVAVNGPDF